ncbi:hypothetical protein GIB67_031111 [Kingdonia uniflora]|uniref:ARM repeat superfamily protein n=1 Tax=Kingdonia uniflora TaxID=39325 RepID=A0A7J7ME65_9MAGN|nr:hypothetical protein GIB67_031111 [Kingdonia uniflora]
MPSSWASQQVLLPYDKRGRLVHAASVVLNISENYTPDILTPYLDWTVSKLLILLQNGNQMVQEGALTALASVADSSQEQFQKYYDVVMPYLKAILVNATDKCNRMLRAKSMECISLVGMAVGKEKFRDDAKQWLDTKPNCSVQYVGLSSWDKHVGYRNVNVMCFKQNQSSSWKHVISHDGNEGEVDDKNELEDRYEGHEEWGLLNFLENLELSDVFFAVGAEEKVVPVLKVIWGASGSFPISSCNKGSIQLLGVDYLILHALLQYIYTGRTQDSVCSVLQVVTSIPSCKILEETCERKFSRHFHYYTTASSDFVLLDETIFRDILHMCSQCSGI